MANAAVAFLLDNLKELVDHRANLILGADREIKGLQNDVSLFAAFLRDTTKKRRKEEATLNELFRQIRDVVYEAEDVVDKYVTHIHLQKPGYRRYITKPFDKAVDLYHIASKVKEVRDEVDRLKASLGYTALIGGGDSDEPEVPEVKTEKIVGFEDEANTIKAYLNETREELDVICVVGMPGLGKTTLAGKIFHDKEIKYKFPTRIWVYISQDLKKKNVFLHILEGLNVSKEDMHQKSDEQLAKKVRDELTKAGKFLLVMDDVWTSGDWDKLRIALPQSDSAGKVLITSRNLEVAQYANKQRTPHKLRFMTPEESWQLFQYEVFGKLECPPELEDTGKAIVEQCRGLPLAIVVIGGILVKKYSASVDVNVKKRSWKKVSERVSEHLTMEDSEGRMERIIALSYDKLPHHLRACFLYLAMFPEDSEISVQHLARMWIAEGFIQAKENVSVSLEETAESYMDDLISRNLVRGDKRRPDGRIKTCRIHDMLRDFCIHEARSGKENFLQEIKGNFNSSMVQNYRRICIHSNVFDFISSIDIDTETSVRSFVSFSKEDHTLPAKESKVIPAAFKLLRVLDVQPLNFDKKVPSDMYQLLHLRYIVLSFNLEKLPAAFGNLWNLETLVAHTTSRTLKITEDIWKLSQLRHLKTNVSASLQGHKAGQNPKEGENLQTLGTISPESCTEQVLNRCHKSLKKLSICGRLESFVDSKSVTLVILENLSSLEKLKLLNEPFPKAPREVPLTRLPPPDKFPPMLKSLTLSDTYLNWSSDISTLGLLQNLVVLKIKDNAFVGSRWEAKDGEFLCLEFLHIGHTDLKDWKASQHHYPRLRCLELHNCGNLEEIPEDLAKIKTFRILDLQHSKNAVSSAENIEKKKQEKREEFELTIFPPLPRP